MKCAVTKFRDAFLSSPRSANEAPEASPTYNRHDFLPRSDKDSPFTDPLRVLRLLNTHTRVASYFPFSLHSSVIASEVEMKTCTSHRRRYKSTRCLTFCLTPAYLRYNTAKHEQLFLGSCLRVFLSLLPIPVNFPNPGVPLESSPAPCSSWHADGGSGRRREGGEGGTNPNHSRQRGTTNHGRKSQQGKPSRASPRPFLVPRRDNRANRV